MVTNHQEINGRINRLLEIGLICLFVWVSGPVVGSFIAQALQLFEPTYVLAPYVLWLIWLTLPIAVIVIAFRGFQLAIRHQEYKQDVYPFRALLLIGFIMFSVQICSILLPVILVLND